MNDLIGTQLQRTREQLGISIEEAAYATRMRPAMIHALEIGDLTAFPNATYAKSFLLLYGKYLRLDVKSVVREMEPVPHVVVDDYQYLTHANETTPGPARRGDFSRPHRLPSWTPVIALGGTTALVVFGLLFWLNMSRIGDVAETPAPKLNEEKGAIESVVDEAQPIKAAAAQHDLAKKSAQAVRAASQAPSPVYPNDPSPSHIAPHLPPIAEGPTRSETITHIDGVEVRSAKVISPVARMASQDAALLAQADAPQTPPPLVGLVPIEESEAPEVEADNSPLARDPNTIEIEPMKKTWVVVRDATGMNTLFEDFLYPSARAMRLPAGKYVIEVREVGAVEIRRSGRAIAYTAGGLRLE